MVIEFPTLIEQWCRESHVAIFQFDLTYAKSLEEMKTEFMPIVAKADEVTGTTTERVR